VGAWESRVELVRGHKINKRVTPYTNLSETNLQKHATCVVILGPYYKDAASEHLNKMTMHHSRERDKMPPLLRIDRNVRSRLSQGLCQERTVSVAKTSYLNLVAGPSSLRLRSLQRVVLRSQIYGAFPYYEIGNIIDGTMKSKLFYSLDVSVQRVANKAIIRIAEPITMLLAHSLAIEN
jgi:hypothetical protein